ARPPPPPPPPDPVARPTMTDLLTKEIAAGKLGVLESPDRALVRLFGDNLFASGKSTLSDDAVPMVNRVATAVNRYDGTVLITGHTDNIPIRKPEFPSNLDLSQARAESVKTLFAESVIDPERLIAEGVGDLEPLNDNSTAELRSKNRRVEITVFY
ncbi:MAG: type VI secretion system protein TssL, long form, partial [Pseudomonadota bacterium]